jgi:uncharacterized protein YceH (UPF0502 family)
MSVGARADAEPWAWPPRLLEDEAHALTYQLGLTDAGGERQDAYPAAMELTAEQGRVLGCLVEKELTTPQAYPLTDNALVAACNQTTNRDPLVQYDVATVRLAVRSLREQGLVRTVHRTGERSDKHRHLLDSELELSPAEVALLAVLLLRGPQTLGELRTRTERMHPFGSVEQVQQVLEELARRTEPLVARLERRPGHKEVRYAELVTEGGSREAPVQEPDTGDGTPRGRVCLEQLASEVAALREEVAALRAQVTGESPG